MSFSEEESECPAARIPLSPVVEMPAEYPDDEESSNLVPCGVCGRTFNPVSLQRHEKVCERLQAKKRKKFDSTKQRQDGLDIPPSSKLNAKEAQKEEKKKKSRWREKHQEFLRTIRAAKGNPNDSLDGGDGGGSPQRNIPSDYVQCPHCERHFGPKAADRHINWCGEQKSRLPRSQTSEDSEAVQRLKTRTKYTPPKPGQNGWRAPKKRDVISSIPPPNVGANVTPSGRLVTPPHPPAHQTSPPPSLGRVSRHLSPPPQQQQPSPSRKASPSSLPTGPPRYGTGSLGRSAGKQFSAMLQSVTGCSPGYGVSTGYGSNTLYGSSPGTVQSHTTTFNRSASLRLPKRRSTGGAGRMARHRDLASDMLASVTLGAKAKREEPEGDEAANMTPFCDRSPSSKTENAPYDPFSAAELQFQDLLGPSKHNGGNLRSVVMGSTNSLKNFGLKRFSPERDLISPAFPKPRKLAGGGSLSLCSLGLDAFDLNSNYNVASPGDDSSELESLENSPRELRSPEDDFDEFLSRFNSSKKQDTTNDYSKRSSGDENMLHSGIRLNSRSRSVSSQSSKSAVTGSDVRKQGEGSYSIRKSSSPPCSISSILNSLNKYSSKEKSPSPQSTRFSPSYKAPEEDNDSHGHRTTPYSGWTSNSDLLGSPKNYSRHFGTKEQTPPRGTNSSLSNSAHDSIKVLDEELKLQRKTVDSLDSQQQRVSSSSSTDSSLPHIASPSVSPPGRTKSSLSGNSSLPIFCYECGNKYPVVVAKFCCHCGAKRLVVAK